MKKIILLLIIGLIPVVTYGAPSITDVSGTATNGSTITITGSGFGNKPTAAPHISSYDHPVSAMNFQATGIIDGAYWSTIGTPMITVQDVIQRTTDKSYVQLEYSANANWGNPGYAAGVVAQFPQTQDSYMAWWEYFPSGFDFSHMATGGNNIKFYYLNPGGHPHSAVQITNDGAAYFTSARGRVEGSNSTECHQNLDLPFGGGFYASCMSWTSNHPVPIGSWHFVEVLTHMNYPEGTRNGWRELKINNNRVYRVQNAGFYDDGENNHPYYDNIRFGGNYGYDDSGTTQYRYYGDLYLDGTFARVILSDTVDYNTGSHVEVQVPIVWSDNSVEITFNTGTFPIGDSTYLFVVDSNNESSIGYQITIGGVPIEIRADVDQNSSINSTDALLTLRNSLGLDMSSTSWQASAITGDVNCDSNSNSTDAYLILRYSLGLDMSSTGWCVI